MIIRLRNHNLILLWSLNGQIHFQNRVEITIFINVSYKNDEINSLLKSFNHRETSIIQTNLFWTQYEFVEIRIIENILKKRYNDNFSYLLLSNQLMTNALFLFCQVPLSSSEFFKYFNKFNLIKQVSIMITTHGYLHMVIKHKLINF